MPRLKDNLRKPAVTAKYRETKLQEVPHEQDIFSFHTLVYLNILVLRPFQL